MEVGVEVGGAGNVGGGVVCAGAATCVGAGADDAGRATGEPILRLFVGRACTCSDFGSDGEYAAGSDPLSFAE